MDELDRVELIRQKCNVNYTDAKEALEAADGNVLDAIIWLEEQGRAQTQSAHYTTQAQSEQTTSPEMAAAQQAYEKSSEKSEFSRNIESFAGAVRKLIRKSIDTKFIVTRAGETIVNVPLIVPILGLFLYGSTLWLLILGLFFGLRYSIKSADSFSTSINDVMDKAADTADSLKRDVKNHG